MSHTLCLIFLGRAGENLWVWVYSLRNDKRKIDLKLSVIIWQYQSRWVRSEHLVSVIEQVNLVP